MNRGALASLAAAALALGSARPDSLVAQQVSLRLGALHARYSDSINGNAGSLGARVAWSAPRSRGTLETTWAQYSASDGAGQGWGSIAFIGPASRTTALGLRADGVANLAKGVPFNGLGTAELYAIHIVRAWTLGASGGGGGVRDLLSQSRPLLTASLRARVDVSQATAFTASATTNAAGATHYTDATLLAEWQRGRYQAGALAGTRTGDLRYHPWVQGWGKVAVNPSVTFEFAAGSYPRDLTGFDHGLFATAGARINLTRQVVRQVSDAASSAAFIAAATAALPPASGDLVIEPTDSARTRVTMRVGLADSVAIAGEWNEWRREPMTSDGAGRWTVVLTVGAGTHRFALIADGTRWIVPPGVTKLPDEFGGEVGLLVVP